MCSARVSSASNYLPRLEEPPEDQLITRLNLGWLEITGLGEGGLNLARMSIGKYFALILIGVLTTALVLS